MPAQKPGRSRQDYATPPDLLGAVSVRIAAPFIFDLACTKANAVAPHGYFHDVGFNAFLQRWADDVQALGRHDVPLVAGEPGSVVRYSVPVHGWAWLNPPFTDIEPWVKKSTEEAAKGLYIAMLVPASVGANWWRLFVEPFAYALHCSPRIKFVGETDYYPKDCSILLYTPMRLRGAETWVWR